MSTLQDNKGFTAASHIFKYKRGISKKLGSYPTWKLNTLLSGVLSFKDWELYLHQTVLTHPHHKPYFTIAPCSKHTVHNMHLHYPHIQDHQQHSTARQKQSREGQRGCSFAGRSIAVKLSTLGHQCPAQALFLAGNATDIRTAALLLSYAEVA